MAEDDWVHVRYFKYDGSLHWHFDAIRLGVDRFGTWLGSPAGTALQRGVETPVVWEVAQVLLVPDGERWWTANFNAAPHPTEIYSDMTTVPRWHGDELHAVDLDLDVARRRGGRTELLDADEFAEHQVRYGYPEEVVAAAQEAADDVFRAVSDGAEPFTDGYRPWLARAEQLTLPGTRN